MQVRLSHGRMSCLMQLIQTALALWRALAPRQRKKQASSLRNEHASCDMHQNSTCATAHRPHPTCEGCTTAPPVVRDTCPDSPTVLLHHFWPKHPPL